MAEFADVTEKTALDGTELMLGASDASQAVHQKYSAAKLAATDGGTNGLPCVEDYKTSGNSWDDAFAAMIAANDAGVATGHYSIETMLLNKPFRLVTGRDTIFEQADGTADGVRLIHITSSNVVLGDCTVVGKIAANAGEQNHGVFVFADGITIGNIVIGDIVARDIRGDGVYVGAANSGHTHNVWMGRITYDNVLRNGISIIDCDGYYAQSVSGDKCGLFAFDVEPNAAGQVAVGRVDYVYGRCVVIASPHDRVEDVSFGHLDLDGSRAFSTPSAGWEAQSSSAVQTRNCEIIIESMNCDNFLLGHALTGVAGLSSAANIGSLICGPNIGTNEATYTTIVNGAGYHTLNINTATATAASTGQIFLNGSRSVTNAVVGSLTYDGTLAKNCKTVTFGMVAATLSTGQDVPFVTSCDLVMINGGSMDDGAYSRRFGYSIGIVCQNMYITAGTSSNVDNEKYINCMVNAVYTSNLA